MAKISTLALLALAAGKANAAAKSLADIKHVIMIMMENRSFQHVSRTKFLRPIYLFTNQIVLWHHGWCSWFCRPQCSDQSQ